MDVEVIPSGSLGVDIALGINGFPKGRVVEIYGPESSGKTTLAIHAIAECQKQGGIAAFIGAEHAFDRHYAANLGVDTDNLLISQPDNGEQALEIAENLIRSGAIDIIVIDSVAALVPRSEIEGEMGDSKVGLQNGRLQSGPSGASHVAGHAQTHGFHWPHGLLLHLHQPVARKNRGHVRQSRNHHRR